MATLHAMANSFLNLLDMRGPVRSSRGEQISGSPVMHKGERRGRGYLFIGELSNGIQRFLMRCGSTRCERLHAVVAVVVAVALIALICYR